MKMSALKAMMMAGAMMVATCLTVNAAPAKANSTHMAQDTTMKKKKMSKTGKMKKMKKDTTTKM